MEKKVLITGAAGLIGRELCKQLLNKFDITGIDNNFRYPNYVPNCKFVQEDLSLFLSHTINDFDYIFHLSAINGTKYFYEIPNKLILNNIISDLDMFKFVEQNINCKLIYASSSEVVSGSNLFPTPELIDINIDNIHNPRWSYRLGKIVGENYLMNSDLNFLIVRIFNSYGPDSGIGHFTKDILDKLERNDYSLIGADETRSFCRVEDVVDALVNIFQIVSNEIINIGNDEEITILEAANMLANYKNITPKWKFIKGNEGSVKRRIPDISKLLKYYPDFKPKKFKDSIKDL